MKQNLLDLRKIEELQQVSRYAPVPEQQAGTVRWVTLFAALGGGKTPGVIPLSSEISVLIQRVTIRDS
jgi:uncharacterized membrane protein